jgi:uncharacterized protein YrrD
MTDLKNPNLLKSQDLSGKPVISLQGEEIGSVAQIVVDPVRGNVAGLTVIVKGWFKGEKGLEFESVYAFGDYAVTVQRAGQVVPLDSLPTLQKLVHDYTINNMRIITLEGKLIGTIDDFYFDKKTGHIERYILTGGIIKTLYKGRASIPSGSIEKIGRDVAIAMTNVEETLQKEEGGLEESMGSIKQDIDLWKDDFEKIWDKTMTKALELSKIAGENLAEAAKTSKGKSKELLTKTIPIVNEKKQQLKASYDWWLEKLQAVKSDSKHLVGFKAGKTVTDDNDQIIISENEVVTDAIIKLAQKTGKIKELLISVAALDLEAKIQAVENEEPK